MSILSSITSGVIKKPVFMCIYGTSGIGKTTFAASAPKPLFIATEEGTNEMDVARLQVSTWEEIEQALDELAENKTEFETVAIDSLDHLEGLIFKKVSEDKGKDSIEDIGYGKGYLFALEYWNNFLTKLKAIRDKQGKHIIMISHANVKTFSDPHHNESYDRFELKMHKKASELIKESVDLLVFARKDIAFKKDDNNSKTKAFDMDGRLLYTELDVAFDAKNRFGLSPKIDFPASGAFEMLTSEIYSSTGVKPEELLRQIIEMIKRVDDKEVAKKALETAQANENNVNMLGKVLKRLEAIVK